VKFAFLHLAAFATAFVTSIFALPLWRHWCLRTGLVDDPGHRKIHSEPIPLAGGLAVMTGLLLPTLAALAWLGLQSALPQLSLLDPDLLHRLTHGLNRRAFELASIFLGSTGMLLVGFWDDRHELRPSAKFGAQLLIAFIVAASGIRITLFVPSVAFSYFVTILWILTVINAFNFMDNMNGLCAGVGAIGAALFAIIAAANGEYLVAITGFLMCGALVGFLPWNFPNAKAFLGDAGSHLVGYLLAVMAILPHFYNRQNQRPFAVLAPLFVLALPLIDLAQVSMIRTINKKPFWIGDTNHLSHRLVRAGFSRSTTVLILWLAAIAIGLIAAFL